MYARLLRLLKDGRARLPADLARELDISPETLRAYMAYLAERGMLARIRWRNDALGQGCAGCLSCRGCPAWDESESDPVIWELHS